MTLDLSLSISERTALVARAAPAAVAALVARPVHVLYGGAHLFRAGVPAKLGARAREAMERWGGDDAAFGQAVGVADPVLAARVAAAVRAKLAARPVEAMCIDFEDGYGVRGDDEEDADAVRAAGELAGEHDVCIGLRVKALGAATAARSLRTLDLFVTRLASAGAVRGGFTVTLPKVEAPDDVALLGSALAALEARLGLAPIAVEVMIETPRALAAVPAVVAAGAGRVVAAHLGAYDLLSELGVTAADQRLDHPHCDHARALLVFALAGSEVGVSDGATTRLPIPPKDADPAAAAAAVQRAWSAHAANVRRALDAGIWQGWDLHPAQLPARYGALFAYFLERRTALAERLHAFADRAAQASRVGQAFDDAATARGLVAFFRRGTACGAFDAAELDSATTAALAAIGRAP